MEKSRSQTGERLFSARKRLSCLRRAIPGKFRFGLIWEVGEGSLCCVRIWFRIYDERLSSGAPDGEMWGTR